jgi:hypothetical protein
MTPRDEDLPRWRLPGMRVRIDLLAVTVLGVALFAAYSVHLKKDIGWDFRNYHYYGCYCLENGRIAFDISAAQLQSYLNPVAYLPYCWAVDHLKPLAAGILFGALAGLNLGLLYQLSFAALAGLARRRVWLALLTAVAGVWSPFFLLLVGSSFTETWTPLLVMLALLALLRDAESPSWRLVFAAGLALGAAAGFKLVNGVFALALLLTIGTTFRRPGFFRRVAGYLAGAAVAFMLVSGPWAFTLQRDFGSPLFPFYNAIFKSPYFPAVNFVDERWQVTTLAGALDRPFDWAANAGSVSSEAPFRDLRFALYAILLLPALAVSIRPDKSATRETQYLFNPVHRSLLLWFFTLSYLLWLYMFGVMRYAVPLELLSSLAILALCDCLIANRGATQRVFVVLALLGIAWVRVPTVLPRPDWGSTWFETTIPRELRAAHALYVMSDSAPSAYLAPMLPADSRFVRLEVNLHIVPPDRYLGPRALSVIDNHAGPLRVLEGERFNIEALSAYGLSVNLDDCLTLHTFADQFNFCSAYRTADGVRSTVPLVHAPLAAQQAAAFYYHELLANHDFQQGLARWEMGGSVEALPTEHAVRVTEHSHLHQLVRVTPGVAYRLVVRARCPEPGTFTRLQVNWVDNSGRGLAPYLSPIGCTSQWAEYATVVHAPANAAAGHFYVTGNTELPVLIQHVSMAW